MLLRRTTTAAAVVTNRFTTTKIVNYMFSTTTNSYLPKPFSKIPHKYRSQAIKESQQALMEYLHTTRSLPYLYADHIAKNSPHSLWEFVSTIPFSPKKFAPSLRRFFRYHPINELEFLLESIGLGNDKSGLPRNLLPPNTFFISDWKHFDVVLTLAALGFPWNKLGLLCKQDNLIFEADASELKRRISEIKDDYGFNGVCVVSICLVFPRVLLSDSDGLLADLKILFFHHDLLSYSEGDVDAMMEVCEKIKLFYDLGCEMGRIGDLMWRCKNVFLDYSKEDLIRKIEYFCNLNVEKDQVGLLLLSRPEILGFNLSDRGVSVAGFLKHFGMGEIQLKSLEQKYPHVFGRNKIANVPRIMRSLGLGEWFFERMQNGDPSLLNTYTIHCAEDLMDEHYADILRTVHSKRTSSYVTTKLDFLHSIGFGENKFAVKTLPQLHSNRSELQERFDCLLRCGVEYSKLCAIVAARAMILNQNKCSLEQKIEYLCTEMGSSPQFLDVFPAYLCFDLEKRIKPRYRFHKWLKELGFHERDYALSTIIASSEKTFIAQVARFNSNAVKKWQDISSKIKGNVS